MSSRVNATYFRRNSASPRTAWRSRTNSIHGRGQYARRPLSRGALSGTAGLAESVSVATLTRTRRVAMASFSNVVDNPVSTNREQGQRQFLVLSCSAPSQIERAR